MKKGKKRMKKLWAQKNRSRKMFTLNRDDLRGLFILCRRGCNKMEIFTCWWKNQKIKVDSYILLCFSTYSDKLFYFIATSASSILLIDFPSSSAIMNPICKMRHSFVIFLFSEIREQNYNIMKQFQSYLCRN